MKPGILIVDDEPATRFGLSRCLAKEGYAVHEAASLAEAKEAIIAQRIDAVVLDQRLPDGSGTDWLPELRADRPDVAIIVITGAGDIPLAVEAMRRGADNFLTKPVNMADLEVFLRKSLELGALRRRDLTSRRLAKKTPLHLGESALMQGVRELAATAAENEAAVLLSGETGTGKGVLARWIHEHGARRAGPFVEINCSSLRGELLASELFGHARGAFTSAIHDRQGLIEVADGGTLFLDEIGDMDPGVQAQFLKVIEEKSFRRLGEVRTRRSDFRLICATNKDLPAEAEKGTFRLDLYYRIQVFPISLPSLRERPGDIAGFARNMLRSLELPDPELFPEVRALLEAYHWPGNIRELKNVIERATLLARRGPLKPEHFPGLSGAPAKGRAPAFTKDLARLEEEHIRTVFEDAGGNVDRAVRVLGISRATLYRKLKKIRPTGR